MSAALSGPGGRVELGTTVLQIGRLPDNQLVVIDVKASSHHAEIRPDAKFYALVDLGSTNGTFVNEQRLIPHTPRTLNTGDSIRIGDTVYAFEIVEAPGYASTIYANPHAPAYDPTIAAPGIAPDLPAPQPMPQPQYPEYQALSPVYAPPPPPQGSIPPAFPVYAQPSAPPPLPGYAPQVSVEAPVQKKSRKGLWISLGVVAAVLVLACGICGALVYVNLPTPAKALDAFCLDVKNKEGDAAFNLFSDSVKSQAPNGGQTFIVAVNQGQVVGCTHTVPITSGESAQAQMSLTAINGSTQVDNVHLATDSNGDWKISFLQAA
jgi:hypothetical protein